MKMITPKQLKEIAKNLSDYVNDFDVIKKLDNEDTKKAYEYIMSKYKCSASKAGDIIKFTREHDSVC